MTVKEIYDKLNLLAPFDTICEPDNVGLLVGRRDAEVQRVLVSLDATPSVIEEAKTIGAQLIVTHHPVLFKPLTALTDEDYDASRALALAEAGIALIAMHTNLDIAAGGVNDCLAARLGLIDVETLPGGDGVLRYGEIEQPADLAEFAAFVRDALGANGVRYSDAGLPVRRVAVGGGACADYIEAARDAGCDTLVLGDCAYHRFLYSREQGINIVDAGHFSTEDVVCKALIEFFITEMPEVEACKAVSLRDFLQWL